MVEEISEFVRDKLHRATDNVLKTKLTNFSPHISKFLQSSLRMKLLTLYRCIPKTSVCEYITTDALIRCLYFTHNTCWSKLCIFLEQLSHKATFAVSKLSIFDPSFLDASQFYQEWPSILSAWVIFAVEHYLIERDVVALKSFKLPRITTRRLYDVSGVQDRRYR